MLVQINRSLNVDEFTLLSKHTALIKFNRLSRTRIWYFLNIQADKRYKVVRAKQSWPNRPDWIGNENRFPVKGPISALKFTHFRFSIFIVILIGWNRDVPLWSRQKQSFVIWIKSLFLHISGPAEHFPSFGSIQISIAKLSFQINPLIGYWIRNATLIGYWIRKFSFIFFLKTWLIDMKLKREFHF